MTGAARLIRVKYASAIKGGAGFPHEEQDLQEEEFPFYKVASLEQANSRGILRSADHTISRATAARLGAHIFSPNAVVFAKVGAALLLNRFRQLDTAACLDNNMMGLEALAGVAHPRYLLHAMSAKDLSVVVNPGAVPSVNGSQIAEERIWLPELIEQERIANFLDDKTARIDALIAEKARLAAAVREYEQAEISRLLAHGVSGSSMQETGKTFVTEAPSGWRVTTFKRALTGMGQGWSPQCESQPAQPGEWGVLKVGCVNGTTFDANENKALPANLEPDLSCVIRKGDVLMSRANTKDLVGMAALVEEDYPRLMLCDKLYRLELRADWVLPAYAVLALRSDTSRQQIELGANGASSSMQNISQDVLRELVVAFPPLDEQCVIVQKARQVRATCSNLAEHVEDHVARLREYRSSVISAAVTGQLALKNNYTAAFEIEGR